MGKIAELEKLLGEFWDAMNYYANKFPKEDELKSKIVKLIEEVKGESRENQES